MAHHLFLNEGRALPIVDADLALIRHLFVSGAMRVGDQALAEQIGNWTNQGPGVWVGVLEETLAENAFLYDSAIGILQEFTGTIPIEYLNTNAGLPTILWNQDQSPDRFVDLIRAIRFHLNGMVGKQTK